MAWSHSKRSKIIHMLWQMRLDSDLAQEFIVARMTQTVRIDECRWGSGDKGDWPEEGRWAQQTVC